jgi:hypothetical protein
MASAAAGALGAGVGLFQTIQGAKQARDAKNALENYERQELKNVAEDLQVSTLGSDLQREEQARLSASQIDALQGSGTRGIIGGLGRVEAGNQNVNRQIAADLDMQQREIDRMRAQDETRIQGMQEQREVADINALSSQYNTGQQNMMSGLGTTIAGTGQAVLGIQNASREKQGLDPVDMSGAVIKPKTNDSRFQAQNIQYNPNWLNK